MSLEILSPAIGTQPEITNLPLLGVTLEASDLGTMTVAAARSAGDHITHTIHAPSHVWARGGSSRPRVGRAAEITLTTSGSANRWTSRRPS